MKHELEHFNIGDSYGGNQDWFPTFMMRVDGCGAETACDSSIYFALHRGLTKGVFQKKKVDVKAPEKEFFLNEGCAHSPIYEDGERTREILNELLKAD